MAHLQSKSELSCDVKNSEGRIIASFEYLSFADLNSANDALGLGLHARYKVKNLQLFVGTIVLEEDK